MASPQPTSSPTTSDIYAQVEQYPWDTDEEYQAGLTAILGSNTSPEQAAELTLRARCFYFSRKFNTHVDFDSYKAYRTAHNSAPLPTLNGAHDFTPTSTSASKPAPTITSSAPVTSQPSSVSPPAPTSTSSSSEPQAPYPTSFAHIVELITTGQHIPGIKEIPPTVLEGQGTQATKQRRRKPWEKDGEDAAAPSTSTSS